eukprot:CAMPEP_0181454642 /NCGR_PEP_ID=MMETSP1110-20121109/30345_1 /TAXON_ID=174948 /ORGANISM="Symbiodinium sp., Strain CCMP421" /LENGTH=243 /DNA_ID=CAMNT_0023578997 /DNA_START=44 /DNA_END=773 /DNA_ORIENTATION=-
MACDIIKFYKWGMFLCLVIATIALYLAIKCPYASVCPAGFAAMLMTGIFAAASGIFMFFVKRSLSHVRKLHMEDLSAKKMTAKTRRCGGIARKCPCWSRWLFFFMSVGVISGFAVGVLLSTCPEAGDKLWLGKDCEMKTPDPKSEFGVLFALWLILAVLSTRVNAQKKPWPFLYEPEPEDTTFKGRGLFAFCAPCDMLSRLLHPWLREVAKRDLSVACHRQRRELDRSTRRPDAEGRRFFGWS